MADFLAFLTIPALSIETIIVIFIFGMGLFFVLLLVFLERSKNGKAIIMHYLTETIVEFNDEKVRDGSVMLGKKQIHVDKVQPITVKGGGLMRTTRPLYVVKWNSALPLQHMKAGTRVVTGENLQHLVENKTLAQLLKPKGGEGKIILWIILGVILGIFAGIVIGGYLPKS
jgi:hypothetical protein